MRPSLGNFRLLEELGEGGMGVVYKAVDCRNGKTVALKVLARQSLLEGEVKHRFLREASAGSKLIHPNVVQIYEVGEVDGEHYISMEFVEGKTLGQVIKDGPLPAGQVVEIGIAVGDALREAHRLGVIHRDIKSANIMLSTDDVVKVMDFGLAKIQNASMLTREGELLGTVTYMSPEQATGETVDQRTDIFSLGVVLYEVLTGKLPFGDQYDMAVVYSILNVDPVRICDIRPDIPEALEQIIFKALRKDLQDRYQNMEGLLGDLRRLKAFLTGKRDTMPSSNELVAGVDLEEASAQTPHMASAQRGAFVAGLSGRDNELETLKALLRKAEEGEGKTVFVSGEAGIGKSRLVSELETYGRTIKIRPVNARCVFREGAIPYKPIVDAVRDILTARGLATPEDMEAYFAVRNQTVVPHLPALRVFLNLEVGKGLMLKSKDQLWEAVLRLVEAVSHERTLLLFVDDLHWADEETLALFQYLARNTVHRSVMLVATYRPEEIAQKMHGRTNPLRDIELEMTREGSLTVLHLERLTEEDVQRMISSLFHQSDFGKPFVESVYRESEGNPLFVVEIMKLLKAEGVIYLDAGQFRLRREAGAIAMPSRVQDIVARRIARLERNEREILEIGAVEGEVFHSETITRCLGTDKLSTLRTLQSLERDYHIIHAQERLYRFDHAKIREALYDSLTPELRIEYHGMIAEYLASAHKEDEQLAPNIAHHFLEAGNESDALPFLITGARRAQALFATMHAVHLYEQALKISNTLARANPAAVEGQKATVLEGLGDVCLVVGDHDRALEAYQMLLATPEMEAVRRGEILQKTAHAWLSKGDNDRALSALADADELLEGAAHEANADPSCDAVRGKTTVIRARVFKLRGEYDEAIRLIDDGLRLLGSEGHLRERADAYNDLGNIYEDRAEYQEAEAMFMRSLSLREEIADKKGIAVTYNNLANIYCAEGNYAKAAAMFQKSLALMKEIGFRVGIAGTCNNLGTIYQDQGRYQESLQMYQKGLQVREEIGDRPGIAMSYGNLGFVHLDLQEYDKAREYLAESVRLQQEIGMKTLLAATTSWLALAHAGQGDFEAGHELALRAVSMAAGLHQRWFEGIAHRSLGIILMEKWRREAASSRSVSLCRESEEHLRTSLAIFEEGKFEHERARTALELAKLLGLAGDPIQSEKYREEAMDLFQRVGAMGDLDRAMNMASARSR